MSTAFSTNESYRLERTVPMLPKQAKNILEIGARGGAMTRRLAEFCEHVTALDLQKPNFQINKVTPVQGNVLDLQFPDNAFDCVICTEVLEHVQNVRLAANEIQRVTRSYALVTVPFRDDTRVGRTTCVHCGTINPPFGHINTFDEQGIKGLFPALRVSSIEYISENRDRTNSLSTWLQDLGGNPYGNYDQEEACISCDKKLERPRDISLIRHAAAALGFRLYRMQRMYNRPRPTWIAVLFRKTET